MDKNSVVQTILERKFEKSTHSKNRESNFKEIGLYKRFDIETKLAKPRNRQPYPFFPIVKKTGLFKLLVSELLEYNIKLFKKKYRRRLFARPCIYGVFSGKFGGFRPIRQRCVGCLRCVQEFPSFCTVKRNPDFLDFADSYWAPDSKTKLATMQTPFSTVWFEAETGKILIKGMGYKGSFSDVGWDTIWTDMSEIVRPTRDGVYGREYISTGVDIGKKPVSINLDVVKNNKRIKTIPLPLIFDKLPDNILSSSIFHSIEKTTKKIPTIAIFSPEQIKKYSKSEYKSNSFGVVIKKEDISQEKEILKSASLIEIESEESSDYHVLREINPRVPIIYRIKIRIGIEKLVKQLAIEGIDGFHLIATYHGKSYDDRPEFIINRLRLIHTELIKIGLRNRVSIILSGGVILAEHIPKAIICGSDLVAIDTAILVALQTKFIGECESSEQVKIILENFDSDWGAQRLTNLLGSWHNQIIEILSAMGIRDIRRLRGDIGRAMFKEDMEKEAFSGIEGFVKGGV